MRAAEIFASPSTREGFGITYAEAMAADCIVIGADHPDSAAREVIGNAGFVAEPTVDGVATSLEKAISGGHPSPLTPRPSTAIRLGQCRRTSDVGIYPSNTKEAGRILSWSVIYRANGTHPSRSHVRNRYSFIAIHRSVRNSELETRCWVSWILATPFQGVRESKFLARVPGFFELKSVLLDPLITLAERCPSLRVS